MEVCRRSSWLMLILLNFLLFSATLQGVQGEIESEGPSESECRPHIEKALKQFEAGETEQVQHADEGDSNEDLPTVEITTDDLSIPEDHEDQQTDEIDQIEENQIYNSNDEEDDDNDNNDDNKSESDEDDDDDTLDIGNTEDLNTSNELEEQNTSNELDEQNTSKELDEQNISNELDEQDTSNELDEQNTSKELDEQDTSNELDDQNTSKELDEQNTSNELDEQNTSNELDEQNTSAEDVQDQDEPIENEPEELEQEQNYEPISIDNLSEEEQPGENSNEDNIETDNEENKLDDENNHDISREQADEAELVDDDVDQIDEDVQTISSVEDEKNENQQEEEEGQKEELEQIQESEVEEEKDQNIDDERDVESIIGSEDNVLLQTANDGTNKEDESEIVSNLEQDEAELSESENVTEDDKTDSEDQKEEPTVEELIGTDDDDLKELRPRDHITQLLKLDTESEELEKVSEKTSEIVLKELKKLYENAIKPLETLYKYRDLSNRHFGDSEIFSKPLILFMGPWSGGKSTIINYLLGIEHSELNLHTGAEPSPAYFNILMYGQEPEILDGTELAADYTFSGLQKFGQGLEERLRGYKFPSKLLEKVNIVEIPGILEVRKQVSRIFPFNDACQWFIDRADIIFLVYDPSKLDVGPETEAILDQLKGREHQTRIVLNKADQVKPEELMRVQGALIWNISPLMSSAQPPIMYTTSLWSQPYEQWAPTRLLQAQERAFLRDFRSAIDKRIDNKIASARRFAVRVRNHAKMVDCYLTTYFNHKSVFGNRKQISDEIINHPQDYHIYEGLSTLTNISRYDLPDPDVYRDFFRLNALYEFQKLSSTCTYFRGCPINRLDVAIAYDLPELVGKHKRLIEAAFSETATKKTPPGS